MNESLSDWVLVPREPTREQNRAGQFGITTSVAAAIYRSMVAARPANPIDDAAVERAITGAMAQSRRDGVAMGDQRWDGSFPTRAMWRAALHAAFVGGDNG